MTTLSPHGLPDLRGRAAVALSAAQSQRQFAKTWSLGGGSGYTRSTTSATP